ncbi:MAG TPA: BTAD domain-containing putative transcriptional regulator [Gaiellaceae bacterium]|nr:BTAD domain-containing putative transcriptional regulator [Gaiellaceae bacterium]
MEIRILGPLEVSDDGRVVALGAGRQRALLAHLALHAREIVATDHLIEELWGGSPPPTAAKALQNLVSQLRRSLGADSIATRPPGYSLRLDADNLDATRFERLAAEGHRLLEEDPGRAGQMLQDALGLWRGRALADFAYENFAQSEITRLDELWLRAIEDRMDADLAMGRGTELVSELEPLVSAHPLRERLRGQLMLALYRSGRQADALEAYRSGRRLLDEELGLEPTDELQRLERAILNHDPSLESPGVAGVSRPSVAQGRRASSRTGKQVPPDSVGLIDLERSLVVGHVLVGRRPVALAIGHGSVWVANADDGTVSRIDAERREVIRTIGIGAPAIDVAVGSDAVWVVNGSDGTVSRIDPSADVVVETIDLRGSNELVWNPTYAVDADDDSVWIAAGPHHVLRIDPATNEPSAIIDVGRVPVGVAVGEEAVWVVTTAERALRIERHTNTATTEVPIGSPPVALTAGKQAVWVSDERGQIWRINPDTATVTQTTPVDGGLMALCATDGAVFAANNADGTVVRIDPQDGRVVGVIPVGHAPTDVAFGDGTIWVSIQSESAM